MTGSVDQLFQCFTAATVDTRSVELTQWKRADLYWFSSPSFGFNLGGPASRLSHSLLIVPELCQLSSLAVSPSSNFRLSPSTLSQVGLMFLFHICWRQTSDVIKRQGLCSGSLSNNSPTTKTLFVRSSLRKKARFHETFALPPPPITGQDVTSYDLLPSPPPKSLVSSFTLVLTNPQSRATVSEIAQQQFVPAKRQRETCVRIIRKLNQAVQCTPETLHVGLRSFFRLSKKKTFSLA